MVSECQFTLLFAGITIFSVICIIKVITFSSYACFCCKEESQLMGIIRGEKKFSCFADAIFPRVPSTKEQSQIILNHVNGLKFHYHDVSAGWIIVILLDSYCIFTKSK